MGILKHTFNSPWIVDLFQSFVDWIKTAIVVIMFVSITDVLVVPVLSSQHWLVKTSAHNIFCPHNAGTPVYCIWFNDHCNTRKEINGPRVYFYFLSYSGI